MVVVTSIVVLLRGKNRFSYCKFNDCCRKKAAKNQRKRVKTQDEVVQGKKPNDHVLYLSDKEVLDNVKNRPSILRKLDKLAKVEGERYQKSIMIVKIGEGDEEDVVEYCPTVQKPAEESEIVVSADEGV